MIVYKLVTKGSKAIFAGSEAEARELYSKAKVVNSDEAPFADCTEFIIVDPGKPGLIAALNKHCT